MITRMTLTLLLCVALHSAPARASEVECEGRFVNPITDICWECLFPISLVGVTCNTGRFTWVYRDRAWGRVHAAQQQRELLELCQLAATEALAQHRESTLIKGQEVA